MNRQRPRVLEKLWLRGMWRGARFALPLLLLLLVGAAPARAQGEENRAGLVVVESDGSVITRCVTFSEPQISGLTLLERSDLSFSSDAGPVGARICSINGDGCPSSDCWCQCKGLPCAYWNYYQQNPDGSWAYASIGAAMRQLGNGDVDGWVWGDGTTLPPAMSFETICSAAPAPATLAASPTATVSAPAATVQPAATQQPAPAQPTATPQPTVAEPVATATATSTSISPASPTPTVSPTATASPTAPISPTATPQPSTPQPTMTAEPAPTASPLPSPSPSNTASSGSNSAAVYAAYAAILALLGGTLLVLRRRRRGGRPER